MRSSLLIAFAFVLLGCDGPQTVAANIDDLRNTGPKRDKAIAQLRLADDVKAVEGLATDMHRGGDAKSATALAEMSTSAGLSDATKQAAKDALLQALHGFGSSRDRAAIGVAEARIEEAAPLLVAHVAKGEWSVGVARVPDGDLNFSTTTGWALGALGDPAATEIAEALARPKLKPHARKELILALSKTGSAKAMTILSPLLKDKDLRDVVITALGNTKDRAAVPILIGIVKDNPNAAWAVLSAASVHGDPALAQPMVDAGALADWNLGPDAVKRLDKLGWVAKSDSEIVHAHVARKKRDALLADLDRTRRVLRDDLQSGSSRRVMNATFAFLALGRDEALKDMLGVLEKTPKGERGLSIANIYLVSGHKDLVAAARRWAKKHGFAIATTSRSPDKVRWGSF